MISTVNLLVWVFPAPPADDKEVVCFRVIMITVIGRFRFLTRFDSNVNKALVIVAVTYVFLVWQLVLQYLCFESTIDTTHPFYLKRDVGQKKDWYWRQWACEKSTCLRLIHAE